MLLAQKSITAETEKADQSIASRKGQLNRADELALKALSTLEGNIVKDASTAKSMLEADGSTVVLLSVMDDTKGMMESVVDLLAKFNAGPHTQALEKDIEKALEDMIAAIQKERQRREDEQQPPPPQPGQGQPPPPPLIQLSAELKMLKSLQIRVNSRTQTVDAERGKLNPTELGEQTGKLSTREANVERLTRELSNKIKAELAARGGGGGAM
jgi:hypothetical protein